MQNYDLECPYCGHHQDVCHDDGQGYSESENHEMECAECEKTFVFQTSISFSYDAYKADCLNGAPHKLKEDEHIRYTNYSCEDCDYTKIEYKE